MSGISIAQGRLRLPVSAAAFPLALAVIGITKVVVPTLASHDRHLPPIGPAASRGNPLSSATVSPRADAAVQHAGVWFDRMALAFQASLGPCRFDVANGHGLRALFLRRDSHVAREPAIDLPPPSVARPLVALFGVRAGRRHGWRIAATGQHVARRHSFRLTFDDLATDGIEGIETDVPPVDAVTPATPAPMKSDAKRNGDVRAAARPLFVADADFGQFDTSARAVALNGQAAAALSIAYDPGLGGLKLKASGAAEVVGMSDFTTLRHSFKLTTVASLPLY